MLQQGQDFTVSLKIFQLCEFNRCKKTFECKKLLIHSVLICTLLSANSCMQMVPHMKTFCPYLIYALLLSWFCLYRAGPGLDSDIYCLKAIKNSLQDPFNHLLSWDFNKRKGYICEFSGVECSNHYESVLDNYRVISIRVAGKGLRGQLPPAIGNCSSLKILDLSFNHLSGQILSGISNWPPYLFTLDLSNNNFTGQIPSSFSNLSLLHTLRLSRNKLTGQIPRQLGLLPHIRVFTVANNFLSGPVPEFGSKVDVSSSYDNNSGLCGGILEPCVQKKPDHSFWYGFVIGYVCFLSSVIVPFMYYCEPWKELKKRRRRRRDTRSSIIRKKEKNLKGTRKVTELLPLALQEEESKELSRFLERLIPRISFVELCKATDSFEADNIIGLGETGITYKAKLPNNNCFLAIKRLYDAEVYKREFLFETMIPGRYKHRNIVPLLGFCIEKKERIMVYKYMSNGRLHDWLHPRGPETIIMEWPIRVHIALGLARGLSWLHRKCKIVHLNIRSECVLLDKNFEPRISNFGNAKFINHSVVDRLRMKLFLINGLAEKGSVEKDVYDFGILLFEMITRKRLHLAVDSSGSVDASLLKCISSNMLTSPSDFYDAIDKSITEEGYDDKILGLLQVACGCVAPNLEERPKMVDIYKTIRSIWEGYGYGKETWHDSKSRKLSEICPVQVTINEIECIC